MFLSPFLSLFKADRDDALAACPSVVLDLLTVRRVCVAPSVDKEVTRLAPVKALAVVVKVGKAVLGMPSAEQLCCVRVTFL